MIFQHTFEEVVSRRKTITRREKYAGDTLREYRGRVAVVKVNGFPRWIVGKDYALHRQRGVKAEVGVRLRIVSLRLDPNPLSIDAAEAVREGFQCAIAFVAAWTALHKKAAAEPCWRIEFILIETGVTA